MRRSPQSSDVSDAMDRVGEKGVMRGFFPVIEGSVVEGEALPVLVRLNSSPKGMKAGLMRAAESGSRGSILVISSESDAYSVWGGYTSWYAGRLGIRGGVVDGAVREVAGIRKLGFPVFAKKRTPVSGTGRLEVVSVGEPVEIEGVAVRKGDWVVADSDGVVIVPRARAEEVRRLVDEIEASEARDRKVAGRRPRRGRASGAHRGVGSD